MRLQNKRVIVTGGGSGIGRSITTRFLKEGANVLVADIKQPAKYHPLVLGTESNPGVYFFETDVSDEENVNTMVNHCIGLMGGIDIVVNNAASFIFGTVDGLDNTEWMKAISVNVVGAANVCKATLEYLKASDNSSIINVA